MDIKKLEIGTNIIFKGIDKEYTGYIIQNQVKNNRIIAKNISGLWNVNYLDITQVEIYDQELAESYFIKVNEGLKGE
jgi:hypothetical protein